MPEALVPPGYLEARESAAVFPDRPRAPIEISGARARRVVNGLVTNSLDGIEEGRARYAFLLDPKGRAITDLRLLPSPASLGGDEPGGEEVLWLDVPRATFDLTQAHLDKYVPPIFARVRPMDVRVISVHGPDADEAIATALGDLGLVASPDVEGLGTLEVATLGGAGLVVASDELGGAGADLYVESALAGDLADALTGAAGEGSEGTPEAWELLRIEHGLPIAGRELTPDRLAQEAGQDDRAISFEKGCFTGQEVVARIHYRGHVNRHLRGLRAAEAADLAVDTLYRDGRPAAWITSRARSPRYGEIALGYVRREVEPGDRLSVGPGEGATVEVASLPFT